MGKQVKRTETGLRLRDGVTLYNTYDIPEGMRALVVFVHGIAEHSGRYGYVAEKMTEAGYGVVRFDLRGHGRSGGIRGYVRSFSDFSEDLGELLRQVRADFSGIPVYTFGHSMGAMISALYAASGENELKGQILSGISALEPTLPFIRTLKKLPYDKFPMLRAANDLADMVSRDPQVSEDYRSDPLNLRKATIHLASEMFLKAPVYLADHVWEYRLPCLLLHGGDDRIVEPRASEWFMENIDSADKTRIVYPGLYHEIFNEKEKDRVIADAVGWLDARCSGTEGA